MLEGSFYRWRSNSRTDTHGWAMTRTPSWDQQLKLQSPFSQWSTLISPHSAVVAGVSDDSIHPSDESWSQTFNSHWFRKQPSPSGGSSLQEPATMDELQMTVTTLKRTGSRLVIGAVSTVSQKAKGHPMGRSSDPSLSLKYLLTQPPCWWKLSPSLVILNEISYSCTCIQYRFLCILYIVYKKENWKGRCQTAERTHVVFCRAETVSILECDCIYMYCFVEALCIVIIEESKVISLLYRSYDFVLHYPVAAINWLGEHIWTYTIFTVFETPCSTVCLI